MKCFGNCFSCSKNVSPKVKGDILTAEITAYQPDQQEEDLRPKSSPCASSEPKVTLLKQVSNQTTKDDKKGTANSTEDSLVRSALNRGPPRDHLTEDYMTKELLDRPECYEIIINQSHEWRAFFVERKFDSMVAYQKYQKQVDEILNIKISEHNLNEGTSVIMSLMMDFIKKYHKENHRPMNKIAVNSDTIQIGFEAKIEDLIQRPN